MITVSEGTQKIIKRSRYLQEALEKGIINISALALYIKPELEEMLIKKTSKSAIIMAINRLLETPKPSFSYKNIFKDSPEMIMRSNLMIININHSKNLINKYANQLELSGLKREYFFSLTEGALETTIVASRNLYTDIKKRLKDKTIVSEFHGLSLITIRLPTEATFTPGIFYFFLKSLAWEGVNIIEIISTISEFTLVFEDKDANNAFSIIRSLFN
ncbi:MAG: hypothetical protein HYT07_01485 [Candidatus Levybacteria bacterium]|nr:hypothetical protein [Candidatus Levybacteria bacterium]